MPTTNELSTDIAQEASSFFRIKDLGTFLRNSFQVVLVIGSISAFLYLMWGGLEYIISAGNQERLKSAKSKITQALFGLAFLAVAWALWRLILFFFGISPSPKGTLILNLPTFQSPESP